jgi:hypothetical protein
VNLKSWTKALRETEWELKAARTRTVVDAAAAKLQRAKAKPQSLDGAERPKPRPGSRIVATLELRYMHRVADDQKDRIPLRGCYPTGGRVSLVIYPNG